jgi:hypothetical protein
MLPTQRDSRSLLFTNGVGDGRLVLRHTTMLAQIAFVLLGAGAGSAAVVGLSRAFRPLRAGGGLVATALLFLAFTGAAWAPFWNGALAGAALATVVVALLERRAARRAGR